MGGESGATLTIFGNGYNINGNGFDGINSATGRTINIYNAGSVDSDGTILSSINGFVGTQYGSFINFTGENSIINVVSSVFTNNTTKNADSTGYNAGGAIRNYQGKLTISNSVFKDNFIDDTKGGYAGAVYSGSAKTDIISTIFDSNYVKSDDYANGGALQSAEAAQSQTQFSKTTTPRAQTLQRRGDLCNGHRYINNLRLNFQPERSRRNRYLWRRYI